MLEASDRNAVQALRHLTFYARGGVLHDCDGVVLAAGAYPYCGTFHNAAIRQDSGTDPDEVVEQAKSFFAMLGRDFVLWVGAHADRDLEAAACRAGFPLRMPASGTAGMVLDAPVGPPRSAKGVELVAVADAAGAWVFANVVANSFAARGEPSSINVARTSAEQPPVDVAVIKPQPREASLAMFANPALLLAPEVFAVIAYQDGDPVSCAMLYQADDVGGVYWVSTVAKARRRGLGELVTRAVVDEAFRRAAQAVVLLASSVGEAIYRRMGFVEVTRYRRYLGRVPEGAAGRSATL